MELLLLKNVFSLINDLGTYRYTAVYYTAWGLNPVLQKRTQFVRSTIIKTKNYLLIFIDKKCLIE